MLKLGCCIPQP